MIKKGLTILSIFICICYAFEGSNTIYVKNGDTINIYNNGPWSSLSVELTSVINSTSSEPTAIAILGDDQAIGVVIDAYVDGEYYDSCNGTYTCELYVLPETCQNHEFQYVVSVNDNGYLTFHSYTYNCYFWNMANLIAQVIIISVIIGSVVLIGVIIFRCYIAISKYINRRNELSTELDQVGKETEIKFEKFIV